MTVKLYGVVVEFVVELVCYVPVAPARVLCPAGSGK